MQTLASRLAALESQAPQNEVIVVRWLRTGEITQVTSGSRRWSQTASDACEQAFIDQVLAENPNASASARVVFSP